MTGLDKLPGEKTYGESVTITNGVWRGREERSGEQKSENKSSMSRYGV